MIINLFLIISLIANLLMYAFFMKYKGDRKEKKLFKVVYILLANWVLFLILQINLMYLIQPYYFDYIVYISTCIIPVIFLLISFEFSGYKYSKKQVLSLLIVPAISLLVLWTNDLHHLFYIEYSTNINLVKLGSYFIIYSIYSYGCMLGAMYILIKSSLRKSGFFSAQTGLIILGCLFPLVPNVLATVGIIKMTIYITPIMFMGTTVCFALAIIKYKALNITPVAFKTVIDTMSDSFVVISDDGTIADMNKTFKNTFNEYMKLDEKDNFFDIIKDTSFIDIDTFTEYIKESRKKAKVVTKELSVKVADVDKYFEIDIQPIKAKDGNEFVATLLLFRDITTAKRDMEIMMKNENLVILGELAGGVAHDINTPITAIKSGITMVKEMVDNEDGQMLLARMDSCANKIIALTNSLRNQIRNIGSEEVREFNIAGVIKDVQIIAHNELISKNVKMNIDIRNDVSITGSSTKLSQVVTNIIVNGIQAYEGKGGMIDVTIDKIEEYALIEIEDWAGGIPESIKPYIFKNILTTKGVSGTGFGLYLAYSVVKGAFGGEITFETVEGKGTKFIIKIPLIEKQ